MLSNIPINLLSETQLGKLFGFFIQSLLVDEYWGVGVTKVGYEHTVIAPFSFLTQYIPGLTLIICFAYDYS